MSHNKTNEPFPQSLDQAIDRLSRVPANVTVDVYDGELKSLYKNVREMLRNAGPVHIVTPRSIKCHADTAFLWPSMLNMESSGQVTTLNVAKGRAKGPFGFTMNFAGLAIDSLTQLDDVPAKPNYSDVDSLAYKAFRAGYTKPNLAMSQLAIYAALCNSVRVVSTGWCNFFRSADNLIPSVYVDRSKSRVGSRSPMRVAPKNAIRVLEAKGAHIASPSPYYDTLMLIDPVHSATTAPIRSGRCRRTHLHYRLSQIYTSAFKNA